MLTNCRNNAYKSKNPTKKKLLIYLYKLRQIVPATLWGMHLMCANVNYSIGLLAFANDVAIIIARITQKTLLDIWRKRSVSDRWKQEAGQKTPVDLSKCGLIGRGTCLSIRGLIRTWRVLQADVCVSLSNGNHQARVCTAHPGLFGIPE